MRPALVAAFRGEKRRLTVFRRTERLAQEPKVTKKKAPEDLLKVGRPTTYTTEIGDRIVELYADGKRLAEICLENDWAPEKPYSIRRWADRIPEFGVKFAEARRHHAEAIVEQTVADAMTITDPHRARVKIQALQWMASKYLPQVFGDKLELAVDQRISLTDALTAAQDRLRSIRYQQPDAIGQAIDITPQIEHALTDVQSDGAADEDDLPDFMR